MSDGDLTPTLTFAVPPYCYYWPQEIKEYTLNVLTNHNVNTMFRENRSSSLIFEKGGGCSD